MDRRILPRIVSRLSEIEKEERMDLYGTFRPPNHDLQWGFSAEPA
jgi:hypothetical protein